MSTESVRVIRERAALLASLLKHPGWTELVAEFDRRKGRDIKQIATLLHSGTPLPDAQREIDCSKGFDDALQWVKRLPVEAEKRLVKLSEAAQDGNEVTE